MAKNKKKKATAHREKSSEFRLSISQQNMIFIFVIIIYLVILLKPMVFDGLYPQGVDVVASRGQDHQTAEYYQETGEIALWNPYIFSGMPVYQLLRARSISIDRFFNWLSEFISSTFVYYLIGVTGCFILFRYLNMPPVISFLFAMSFVLLPHYSSLYLEGHYAKFRAVMYVPWITLTFLYFLDRRSTLSVALFALAFGLQIRTMHYQIVFYTALLIFALGIYPFLKDLLEKKYKLFMRSTLLLVAALVLGIGMAAQPLFLANEYLPYSKRGKTTINLKQKEQTFEATDQSAGVKIEYATQWSTHPSEIFTWFIPRYYGGMSGEKYKGSAVPALKNRTVPGYWGYMPFTQSYEYMGVVTLMLAAIGIYAFRKNRLIIALLGIGAFFIILSFGRHFQDFYELFFNYFPYFNKFRAPMMSVTITGFILIILAAFGMNYLYQIRNDRDTPESKNIIWIPAAFIGLGVLFWFFSLGFSYLKGGENYEPQVMDMIVKIRAEFFTQDLIRYFLIALLSGGAIFAYLKNKLSFAALALIIVVICLTDLTNIQSRYQKEFVNIDKLEKQYFRKTATDQFLLSDPETYRIFPPPQQMNENRWAYYHQTIGGYTPIKMYAMEEILENNLLAGWDQRLPINENILKILNVKYVLLNQNIQHENLQLVYTDNNAKIYTYLFREHQPRAFIVDSYRIITDEYERLEYFNTSEFNPAQEAVIEESLTEKIDAPDSAFCTLVEFTPNLLRFNVFTDTQSLMVISESYYPPGWKIFIDDVQASKVYKTNHAMQSVIVPSGNHSVAMRFEPDSYYRNLTLANISSGIIILTILISLFMANRKNLSALLNKPQ